MSCPGQAGTRFPECAPAEMTSLLQEAAAAIVARIATPAAATVPGLDRGAIEALLPRAAPRRGGGAARLRTILLDEFLPTLRDYRHPLHLGHQRPAPGFASLYADLAAAAFNPSVTMFEGGPYAVAVEGRVLAWMKELAGYPADAVATLVNGGAESNLTALMVARDQAIAAGAAHGDLRILAGEHAHYSIARARHVLGLPAEALVAIPSRADLAMDVAALAATAAREQSGGHRIMAIVAAAGATANGAFDDLRAQRAIADRHGAWFHVDAAHGGAALLAPRLAPLVAGIEAADSLVIDPHKMFFVSAPCSVLLCRRRGAFAASLGIGLEHADYVIPDPQTSLMQSDGDEPLRWTLACTRFFAAFRLYAAIAAYGLDGLGVRVERCCAAAGDLAEILRGADDFELLADPAFNMVCFRHLPPGCADADAHNRRLRRQIAAGPEAYLTGCLARGAYWLRAQIMSPNTDRAALARLPEIIRRNAAELKGRKA
ncbi:aromatic-L-amino-acid decarboxylase/L-2,4-diaminobutyrate decarboxylase [Dongia mobilis]|uniref:Aromatic-L-amino-acid decarboxylase/L-2,4-diaminobutyrate decarboxylase n=1 Tax=Dongia mobilis TaxID=578943 RepID=A0A4R6WM37_9PROT|nr:pyridoxal-dependent decarboxylase [Dongia mobilis]TDQ82032.1 aromatic-L-amino-acid decarboxylase/L-2,4-diaminobutyrate decarboxylase [Dongia mobilis]